MHHAHAHSNAFHRNFSFEIDSLRLKRKENFKWFYLVEMEKTEMNKKCTNFQIQCGFFCGRFRCFARAFLNLECVFSSSSNLDSKFRLDRLSMYNLRRTHSHPVKTSFLPVLNVICAILLLVSFVAPSLFVCIHSYVCPYV